MASYEKFPKSVIPGDLICPIFEAVEEDNKQIVHHFVPGNGCKLEKFSIDGKRIDVIVSTLKGHVEVKEVIKLDLPEENKLDNSFHENSDEQNDKSDKDLPIKTNDRIVREFLVIVSNISKISSKYVDDQFSNNLPQEGDIVLARVTRISLQRINVEILAIETSPLPIDSGIGSNGTGFIAAGGGSGAATFSVSQASSDLGETFRGIIRSQDVRATDRDRVKVMESFKPGDIVRAQILSLGDGMNYYLTTARNDLGVVFAKSLNGAGELMYAIDWQTMISPKSGISERRKCAKPF